jgi:hypothetical protein
MNVSAGTKALLHSFSKATLTAGKAIIKVGRKIIDVLFSLLRQFPHLTFGAKVKRATTGRLNEKSVPRV